MADLNSKVRTPVQDRKHSQPWTEIEDGVGHLSAITVSVQVAIIIFITGPQGVILLEKEPLEIQSRERVSFSKGLPSLRGNLLQIEGFVSDDALEGPPVGLSA